MLGPLYVLLGPLADRIYLFCLWDVQAEGMPWCSTRPPKDREFVSVLG